MSGSKHISRLKKHGFSPLTSDGVDGLDPLDVRLLAGFTSLCFMRFEDPAMTLALDAAQDVWVAPEAVDLTRYGFQEVRRQTEEKASVH